MYQSSRFYDIAIIGAGPAGAMAAIRAGQLTKSVILLERNDSIGKKILLTGQGRCNLTNTASLDRFIRQFGKQGLFLRPAFLAFFNQDLRDFFESGGLKLKIERQGRIFPVTDKSYSVVKILKAYLSKNGIKVFYNMRLIDLKRKEGFLKLELKGRISLQAKKVILATGGVSFKETGSSGDGFHVAEKFGHTITPLKPGLVPLKVKELWVKDLQGLSLKNIRIIFAAGEKSSLGEKRGRKKIVSDIGEMMFTHFGVSGPLVLDLSAKVISILEEHKEVHLFIDLKPALQTAQLEKRLLNEFSAKGKTQLKNIMKNLLPKKMIPVFVRLSGLNPAETANQINRAGRRAIIDLLKALPLTVIGSLPIEEAMVTGGGISLKEINPKTMESKIIPGLYFAGEIIDGCASSGGYNLQQAFSTGYLAGEKAAITLSP
ncbi:MAG: NAD(P)/FAD-dependent oxidoreductase [Candidatus Ratteibacteria bacterium]|nr:NAD(P)/FAD-dependent oxidoreductase [Candidatus Ratteibacteria bacterium]